ncbi:MAG: peptidoglycan-binding domain-containing protein, partial [Pseudomonadota bacterium]
WRDPEDALSLAEKQRLQTLLNAMGWDTGGVDGILGRKSRDALRAYQVSMGFVPDGYADRQLFHRLNEAL